MGTAIITVAYICICNENQHTRALDTMYCAHKITTGHILHTSYSESWKNLSEKTFKTTKTLWILLILVHIEGSQHGICWQF